MKKIVLIGGLILVLLSGCQKAGEKLGFVDYGINSVTNEYVVAEDGASVVWVKQDEVEQNGSQVVNNSIRQADINGANEREVMGQSFPVLDNGYQQYLRIMGYYPEAKVLLYAIESKNNEFGPEMKRELYYVYLDSGEKERIGENYFAVFKTAKGIQAIRGGKALVVYQFSVKNSFSVDSAINYNKDLKAAALFTQALVAADKTKLAYVFSYDPPTQGDNENKLMVSDFDGQNRQEVLSTTDKISLIDFDGEIVKAKVGAEEKSFDVANNK